MAELTPIDYGRIVRPSIAHNIKKINEVVDWINNSDIKSTKLLETGFGTAIEVGTATQLATLNMDGKAVQDGTPTPDNPVPIQVLRGRNLLPNTATSQTVNGITFTVNADESVTANGTASADASFTIGTATFAPSTTYTVSGCPSGDGSDTYKIRIGGYSATDDTGTGRTFNSSIFNGLYTQGVNIVIKSGTTVTNKTFYPQLELGSTPTPYVPYGHVGLEVRDSSDELVSVTPIPLPSKGFAAALPDGTADALSIDSAGKWEWESVCDEAVVDGTGYKSTSIFAPTNGNTCYRHSIPITDADTTVYWNFYATMLTYSDRVFGTGLWQLGDATLYKLSGTNSLLAVLPNDLNTTALANTWLAENPITVLYPTATPTIEHGYIDLPEVPDNATLRILATLETSFDAGWFTETALPEVVNSLVKRIEGIEAAIENGRSTTSLDSQSTLVSSQSTIIKDTNISLERNENETLEINDTEVI